MPSDGNIRYYEFENDKFEYLSQHSSPDPQRGVAFLPKRGIDTRENEVMRAFRTVNDTFVEPVSFIVPRRAEVFQDDIYPPTVGIKPGLSSSEWFAGKIALPPKISLASLYDGQAPEELPGDYQPPTSKKAGDPSNRTTATKTNLEPEPKPEAVAASITRVSPPDVKDNQASISSMASKFADSKDDDDGSDGDASSFEEVPKPVERPVATAQQANDAAIGTSLSEVTPASAPVNTLDTTSKEPTLSRASEPLHRSTSSTGSATGGVADGLKSHLREIKEQLAAQNEKIDALTNAFKVLKAGTDDGDRAKDERIRMLELELEQLRG